MRHLHTFDWCQDKVRLLPGEKTLDLHMFSDATFLEASLAANLPSSYVGKGGEPTLEKTPFFFFKLKKWKNWLGFPVDR